MVLPMKTKNAATATNKKKAMKAMKAKKAMKAMKAAPMKSGAMTATGACSAVAETTDDRELVPKDLKDAVESYWGFKESWCYNMLGQLHGMLADDVEFAILSVREAKRRAADPLYVPMEL